MRIIEDVYGGDLVVYFGVYVRVVTKASMKFDTRYIAKSHPFALFDRLLSLILKGGGLSITSVNMLQALPTDGGRDCPREVKSKLPQWNTKTMNDLQRLTTCKGV